MFAGSLHGCLDLTMKRPWNIPEILELLQDIQRITPLLIAKNDKAIKEWQLEHNSRMWTWVRKSIPFQNVNAASVSSGSDLLNSEKELGFDFRKRMIEFRKRIMNHSRMVINHSRMVINHSRIQRLRSNTSTMSLKSNITRREISGMWHNLLEILIAAWKIYWFAWFSGSSKPLALAAPEVKAAAKTTPVPNPILACLNGRHQRHF